MTQGTISAFFFSPPCVALPTICVLFSSTCGLFLPSYGIHLRHHQDLYPQENKRNRGKPKEKCLSTTVGTVSSPAERLLPLLQPLIHHVWRHHPEYQPPKLGSKYNPRQIGPCPSCKRISQSVKRLLPSFRCLITKEKWVSEKNINVAAGSTTLR